MAITRIFVIFEALTNRMFVCSSTSSENQNEAERCAFTRASFCLSLVRDTIFFYGVSWFLTSTLKLHSQFPKYPWRASNFQISSGSNNFKIFYVLLYFLTSFTFLFFPFSLNLYHFPSVTLAVWSLPMPPVKTESKKAFCSSVSLVSLAISFPSAVSSGPMCPLIFLFPLMPP